MQFVMNLMITGSQILIPQSHLYLGCNSVATACVTALYLVQVLQESGHYCFAAVSDPKGPSALVSQWWQYSTLLTSYISTKLNILVNFISSDHTCTAYYKGFYFRCYCTCKTQPRTQGFLKRSHDLIIKRVYRYNNHRYILLLGKINFSQKLGLIATLCSLYSI